MRYHLRYYPQVRDEIRHLTPEVKRLVQAALEELADDPHAGTPLIKDLKGYWKYRAKRYRIIYQISPEKREIVILLVDQRATVYDRLHQILKLTP